MSKQHTGPYSQAEIEELYSKYSDQKVAALVSEAELVAESEDVIGDVGDSYESKTIEELSELLGDRGLPKSGKNKAELVSRLEEDDASKAGSSE